MHPCRHCFTPQARMSDVHSPFKGEQRVEKRIQASIQKTIETCVTALGSNVRGINKLVEDLAKKLSVNVIINALWYVPWGDSVGGVFHGTPPELLPAASVFAWTAKVRISLGVATSSTATKEKKCCN